MGPSPDNTQNDESDYFDVGMEINMGPLPDNKQNDESDSFDVGIEEIVDALERTFEAVLDGRLKSKDYSFTFTTSERNEQFGSWNRSPTGHPSDEQAFKNMLDEVEEVLKAVEDGSRTEEYYRFELSTEYYIYESGEYPQQDNDGQPLSDESQEQVSTNYWLGQYPQPDNNGRSSSDESQEHVSTKHVSEDHSLEENGSSSSAESQKHVSFSYVDHSSRLNSILKRGLHHIAMITHKVISTVLLSHGDAKKKITVFHKVIYAVVVYALLGSAAASPIAVTEHHSLTLTAGKDGTIPFECSNDHQSDAPKYYTVTLEGKDRPFYRDGVLDPDGLMSPDQVDRFSVNDVEDNDVMSIEIHITSVSLEDQGTYIVMVIVPSKTPKSHSMKKAVMIYIPPGPAACFIQPSTTMESGLKIHCHTKGGNGDPTLACFQNGAKIPYLGGGSQIVSRRIFHFIDTNSSVSCCSHDVKEMRTITESECNQFKYPYNHDIINPDPTKPKVTTDTSLVSRPLSNNKETKLPPRQITVHSGCAQSFNWQKAMFPLMAIVACVCIFSV